jgi:hypothetical protein
MMALATLFQPNKIVKMDHVARELFSLVRAFAGREAGN